MNRVDDLHEHCALDGHDAEVKSFVHEVGLALKEASPPITRNELR